MNLCVLQRVDRKHFLREPAEIVLIMEKGANLDTYVNFVWSFFIEENVLYSTVRLKSTRNFNCLIVFINKNVILIEKQHLKCIVIWNYDDLNNVQFAQKHVVSGVCLRDFYVAGNVLTLRFTTNPRLRISCGLQKNFEPVSGALCLPCRLQTSLSP